MVDLDKFLSPDLPPLERGERALALFKAFLKRLPPGTIDSLHEEVVKSFTDRCSRCSAPLVNGTPKHQCMLAECPIRQSTQILPG
jgi:hypothetical protein